ncbi:MAG: histidinol-phosphate transaminase [Deltaproteobacteria bacterium]|nr:histidinol-phosphate transaminase [Deltaproteobacteria bacterium]HCH66350.1 histidinol-phosphate transaminase [Deltaproteobacteria bacterium]
MLSAASPPVRRPLVADHIARIRPFVPGRPISAVKRELGLSRVVKLASNESPLGPSPRAKAALHRAMDDLSRYPDAGHFDLRAAIAAHTGLPAELVSPGNGTTELITLLVRAFVLPGTEVLTSEGTFVAYKLGASIAGRRIVEVPLTPDHGYDLDAMVQAVTPNTRLVFIANPNNPTGTLLSTEQLERFVQAVDARCPDDPPVIVFDEAYIEYVQPEIVPDTQRILHARARTVILRTFSKAYGLAALRCGYALAAPELVGHLDRVRSPFNVNALAQAACTHALADQTHLHRIRRTNAALRESLADRLTERGLAVTPSHTNFLLVDVKRDANEVFEALMREGIITRPATVMGFPTSLRISVGTPRECRQLLQALDTVLGLTRPHTAMWTTWLERIRPLVTRGARWPVLAV